MSSVRDIDCVCSLIWTFKRCCVVDSPIVYPPSVMMPAMFKRAMSGEVLSPEPKARKTDPETPAKEDATSVPPMLHGVKRAVQPPSRGQQSTILRLVTDIYHLNTRRMRTGMSAASLLCPSCVNVCFQIVVTRNFGSATGRIAGSTTTRSIGTRFSAKTLMRQQMM